MKIDSIVPRQQLGRKVQGIAAALLPFEMDGRIAVEAFQDHLRTTHRAGLMNAVNMDTGYVNYLSEMERLNVLRWTREALGKDVPFVAGTYIEGQQGDIVALYRKQMGAIVVHGGIPIVFQTSRLHRKSPAEKAAAYKAVCRGYPGTLAFELGPMFATNGEIFDEETFRRLMEIPEIKGMKHSSLDRIIELQGLATFAPEKFAERDRLWETGDPAYYALSDALQYLGNVAFRDPVPAYKHSAAVFLHLTGRIPTDLPHPQNPKRPAWECEILQDCARRF